MYRSKSRKKKLSVQIYMDLSIYSTLSTSFGFPAKGNPLKGNKNISPFL